MKPRALLLLWLVVVGVFASFAVLQAGLNHAQYYASFFNAFTVDLLMGYGGIGFTVATCLTASLHAVQKLRTKSTTFVKALLFVFLASAVAAFVPPLGIALSSRWQGEAALGVLYLAVFTVGIGLFGFIAFAASILLRRRDA